jgi:uncharacterized protein
MLASLSAADWTLLALAAVLVGFTKTAVSGVGVLAVVLFALVLPARISTGALLPLLIAGDVVAVSIYHRHGSVHDLVRLLPGVVPGLLLGALFVGQVNDSAMELAIGRILLLMGAIQIIQRVTPSAGPLQKDPGGIHPLWTLAAGATAGFATMTANAAGPVMTLYLIMAGLPMLKMLGTGAWFFLVVNLLKVPLSTSLDLITAPTLLLDLWLIPAMLLGAVIGHRTIRRLQQRQSNWWHCPQHGCRGFLDRRGVRMSAGHEAARPAAAHTWPSALPSRKRRTPSAPSTTAAVSSSTLVSSRLRKRLAISCISWWTRAGSTTGGTAWSRATRACGATRCSSLAPSHVVTRTAKLLRSSRRTWPPRNTRCGPTEVSACCSMTDGRLCM